MITYKMNDASAQALEKFNTPKTVLFVHISHYMGVEIELNVHANARDNALIIECDAACCIDFAELINEGILEKRWGKS